MGRTLGIVSYSERKVHVEGVGEIRSIGALSILGRYRVIDFMVSNMTNSGIDRVHVYLKKRPRAMVEHLGSGTQYNINSKNGGLLVMFPDKASRNYDTDIAAYNQNMWKVENTSNDYVVITPSHMIFTQDFEEMRNTHIESGADVSVLYHMVDNAKENYLDCDILTLDSDKRVTGIMQNTGKAKRQAISLQTYFMSKEMYMQLVIEGHKEYPLYDLVDLLNEKKEVLNIKGIPHKGYFAAITSFKQYYQTNMDMLNVETAKSLFDKKWDIFTRTNDSCPTKYCSGAVVKGAFVSNGCIIEGTVENSVIGRGCIIEKGAVVKDSIILTGTRIGKGVHLEGQVVDKFATVSKTKELIADANEPGYIRYQDKV